MNSSSGVTANVVDTGKVSARRKLTFNSVDQVLDEVDRLIGAERAGRLSHVGNWTLGQTLGHLAAWAEYPFAGYPRNPPFFVKWILRMRKQAFIHEPMCAGVKIPGIPGGTIATDPMPTDEAAGRLHRALARLKSEAPSARAPDLRKAHSR